MSIMGTRVVRTEDPRLLTSGGTYVADVQTPDLVGAAQVTFVRSPLAHAVITAIDVDAARSAPGVVTVLTAGDMPDLPPPPEGEAVTEPLLATDRVRFVGEPVAVVLTEDRYLGEDAAELVSVDYEPLPAVVGAEAALAGDTLLFPDVGSNVIVDKRPEAYDDDPFDGCDIVAERTIVNQRLAPVPIEGRAVVATFDGGKLTVWVSTQNAQISRSTLALALGLDAASIRVIAPDVGGGFGAKIGVDRDAVIVAWAAKHLGRPVRWVETRSENMTGMTHGRDQRQTIKIGGTRDGKILGYRLDVVQDTGAYARTGGFLPMLTTLMAQGVYDIPVVQAGYRVVVTNTTPINAYRGAGRPEATAAIERAVDLFAAEAGLDPAEVRRRNFISPDKFPYTTKTGALYDTGQYADALEKVLEAADYRALRVEQRGRREANGAAQLGIGLSTYVEITALDAAAGETARLVVHDDDSATVYTGSSAHGQGHHTAWAMVVQDELGIPMDRVTVMHGDTDLVPEGTGTYASRSLQLGGSAVHKAAAEVKEEARMLAADMLEASADDLELDTAHGVWQVRGDPATATSWGKIAARKGDAGLVADVLFKGDRPTFPFGAHLAVVEVDTETGKVRLIRHVTVDDAGPVVNPVLAEGQRHGGIGQGAAQALLEQVLYDADGNPLTSTLTDYAFITAPDLPSFELLASETPTDRNLLGVKGIGEAGTLGSVPAVQNAVVDALAYLGVRHIDMPLTPERVWRSVTEVTKARLAQ